MLQGIGSDIPHIDELNGRIVTSTREQYTADDMETLALSSQRLPPITVRLDALGRTFHQ